MADFTATEVQALRRETGAGMMDAKRALEEAGGDPEGARKILREQGLADAKKRSDRAQTQGAIGSYLHQQSGRPVIGVLVELAAETDFVAKSDDFQQAANDIAMHVAAARPDWVRREDVPDDVVAKEKDLIGACRRIEKKAAVKKPAAKKAATKRTAAKKAATKKPIAKKAAPKKAAPKKRVAKKAATRTVPVKASTAKKAAGRRRKAAAAKPGKR